MPRDLDFQQRVQRIEELVQEIERAADPAMGVAAKSLMQCLMDLHGRGIERMLEIIHLSGDYGQAIIDQMGREDPVRGLLLLYGLHPLDLETRVTEAFRKAQLQLRSRGASAELVGIDEQGTVRLRLEANGCGSTAAALRNDLENAIREAAPDAATIVVEGAEERTPFVPVAQLMAGVAGGMAGDGQEAEARSGKELSRS